MKKSKAVTQVDCLEQRFLAGWFYFSWFNLNILTGGLQQFFITKYILNVEVATSLPVAINFSEIRPSGTTSMIIIFWDFLMLYRIFISPQVTRSAIISNKHDMYELSFKLPNDLRLCDQALPIPPRFLPDTQMDHQWPELNPAKVNRTQKKLTMAISCSVDGHIRHCIQYRHAQQSPAGVNLCPSMSF